MVFYVLLEIARNLSGPRSGPLPRLLVPVPGDLVIGFSSVLKKCWPQVPPGYPHLHYKQFLCALVLFPVCFIRLR